jgi:hypothetical protein
VSHRPLFIPHNNQNSGQQTLPWPALCPRAVRYHTHLRHALTSCDRHSRQRGAHSLDRVPFGEAQWCPEPLPLFCCVHVCKISCPACTTCVTGAFVSHPQAGGLLRERATEELRGTRKEGRCVRPLIELVGLRCVARCVAEADWCTQQKCFARNHPYSSDSLRPFAPDVFLLVTRAIFF